MEADKGSCLQIAPITPLIKQNGVSPTIRLVYGQTNQVRVGCHQKCLAEFLKLVVAKGLQIIVLARLLSDYTSSLVMLAAPDWY